MDSLIPPLQRLLDPWELQVVFKHSDNRLVEMMVVEFLIALVP